MKNPEFLLENGTLKVLRDYETENDHLISARRTDQVIVNNNKKRKPAELLSLPSLHTTE